MSTADTPTKRRPYTGAKRGPKLVAGQARTAHVDFRCTDAYKTWIEKFAASRGEKPAAVIARGLEALAKLDGFEEPPIR